MEFCSLCKKEFKNLGSHLKQKHDLSREDYTLMISDDMELTNELPEPEVKTMSGKEQVNHIMDIPNSINEDMTVGDLLRVKELTLDELIDLIKTFKGGVPSVFQMEKKNQAIGEHGAKELLGQDKCETNNLHVAEALTTKYGYECSHISKDKGVKTWHLFKRR